MYRKIISPALLSPENVATIKFHIGNKKFKSFWNFEHLKKKKLWYKVEIGKILHFSFRDFYTYLQS